MMRKIVFTLAFCVATGFAFLLPRIDKPPQRFDVAMQLMDEGRGEDAAVLFQDPAWQGVAEYRALRYRRALSAFFQDENVLSVYNMGNSYVRLYEWAGAKSAYRKVLLLDPNHADARHNLDIVLRAEALEREQIAEKNNQRKLGQWRDGNRKEEPPEEPEGDLQEDDQPPEAAKLSERAKQKSERLADQSGASNTAGLAGDTAQFEDQKAGSVDEQWQDDAKSELGSTSNATLIRRESTQAAEVLLRQIKDDPQRVLAARLRIAHRLRKEKDDVCVGC